MDRSDFVTPISFSDRNKVKFSHSDGSLDGSLNFLVAFPSKADEVLLISNNSIGFEASSLTGLGLFLNRLDFHDFFFKRGSEEGIYDLLFLDGDGESEYVDDVVNEFSLNKSAKFGDRFPFDFFFLSFRSFSTFFIICSSSSEASFFLGGFVVFGYGLWLFSHKFQLLNVGD